MKINELLSYSLESEQSLIAHAIYTGLIDGVLDGSADVSNDMYDLIDTEKAYAFYKANKLGIKFMDLYAAPIGEGMFAMFFAATEMDAKSLYKKSFAQECKKMHLMNHGMDMSMYSLETKKHETWREIRDSMPELPAYAGIFKK